MKRGLGDVIKGATTAVGIKPCEGCQKRAEALNHLSRRGILKSAGFALFSLKNSALKWIWTQAGAVVPVDVNLALGLLRTLGAIQVVIKGFTGANFSGPYSTRQTLFTDPTHGVVTMVGRFPAGSWIDQWLSRVNFYSDAVLPEWVIDVAVVNSGNGYRTILTGPEDVLIEDETGIIYRAPSGQPNVPTAAALTAAKDYPNAVSHERYIPPSTGLLDRLLNFFKPRVVHAIVCCANNANCVSCYYGCCGCATNCCTDVQCYDPRGQYYKCFFNPGCNPNPFIVIGTCFKSNPLCTACAACAHKYWGTSCMCTCYPCTPQC